MITKPHRMGVARVHMVVLLHRVLLHLSHRCLHAAPQEKPRVIEVRGGLSSQGPVHDGGAVAELPANGQGDQGSGRA